MATYEELHNLKNDSGLLDQIETACVVAASNVVNDASPPANQAQRKKWAAQTFSAPEQMAKKMIPAVLAANKGATVAQIQGATDAAVQTAVNGVVDLFADLIV